MSGRGRLDSLSSSRIESASPWLGGRRFWVLAATTVLLVLGAGAGRWYWIERQQPEPVEALVFGGAELAPGDRAHFRVLLRSADSGERLAGRRVHLALASGDTVRLEQERATGDDGVAAFEASIPTDLTEGEYTLRVRADGLSAEAEPARPVRVRRAAELHLATDKPLYQPGQTIRMRVLALAVRDGTPAKKSNVVFEVRDGRGNKVFEQTRATSPFGIGSADFELAPQVNTGSYAVTARVGQTVAEQRVNVERYVLPRFGIDIETDGTVYRPGAPLKGSVRAVYTFGRPVAGASVEVKALADAEPVAQARATTGDDGRASFELALPEALARDGRDVVLVLEAAVRDGAAHEERRAIECVVSERPIRVEAFPEAGELVAGVDNVVYLRARHPGGGPAEVELEVTPPGKRVKTNATGIAPITLRPEAGTISLVVRGAGADETLTLPARDGLLLHTDRALYQAGATAKVTLRSAALTGAVMLDAVQGGRVVLTRQAALEDGRAELALALGPELFGTIALYAHHVAGDGQLFRATRLIEVDRRAELAITAKLDRPRFRPGHTATLELSVAGAQGKPAVAAISLAGVDEALRALEPPGEAPASGVDAPLAPDADPLLAAASLARRAPPEVLAARGPESHAARRARLEERKDEQKRRIWAALAMLPGGLFFLLVLPLLAYGAGASGRRPVGITVHEAREGLRRALAAVVRAWALGVVLPAVALAVAVALKNPIVLIAGAAAAAALALGYLVLSITRLRRTPLAPAVPGLVQVLSLLPAAYALAVAATAALAWAIDSPRALSDGAAVLLALLMFGCWAIALGTAAASARAVIAPTSRVLWLWIVASRTGLALLPLVGAAMFLFTTRRENPVVDRAEEETAAPAPAAAPGPPRAAPRVRRHFPETLLWRPELVTDEQGRASLQIPLADSITTWRLGMSAVSASGARGAAELGLEVRQDFFVDVDLPAALTQNDVVSVPVRIHNHLKVPQSMRLELARDSWYKLEGSPRRSITVSPDQVTSVSFEIEVDEPGEHRLRVIAIGHSASDAIERRVEVAPDGERVETTVNGELVDRAEHVVTIPPDAIDGASDLHLKLYPGAFSQVAEGMEGVFRMPSGCFEQTSSVTYPSLLSLEYMRKTKQIEPELEDKALGYLAAGYQRLLTFEVPGGGFSWFGEAPAGLVLSAYGLMHLSEMARVRAVDAQVLERTSRWLLSQQADDGSFRDAAGFPNEAPEQALRTTAYVAWALAEAQPRERDPRLVRALDRVAADAESDAYTLALRANALLAAGDERKTAILDKLHAAHEESEDGVHWRAAGHGVTYSSGPTLEVEATALAAYALLRADSHLDTAHRALGWLLSRRDPHGTWRSTQATVAAMRALLAGAGDASTSVEGPVTVAVRVGGRLVDGVRITPETSDVHRLVNLREHVKSGSNRVALSLGGRGRVAYQLVAVHHRRREPAAAPDGPLGVTLSYDAASMRAGDILTAQLRIAYDRPEPARMLVAELTIPAGFEPLTAPLDDLVRRGTLGRYTLDGPRLVLYVRELLPGEPLELSYGLRALYPVRVKAPGARVYLYYEPSLEARSGPAELTVE